MFIEVDKATVLHKHSTFEPWGGKKWSKSGCFHPPGCEIEN